MDKLDEATGPTIEPVENRMVLADGSAKPFFGRGTFDLEIEGDRARHEIWIADIEVDGILSMDYLRKHGRNIGPGPEGDLKLSISNPQQTELKTSTQTSNKLLWKLRLAATSVTEWPYWRR